MMATTAGEGRSWLVLGGLTIGALAWQAACEPNRGGVDTGVAAATTDLLASVGPLVVLPAFAAFESDVDALAAAVADWQSTLAAGGDGESELVAAQESWVAAMVTWQQLELMQIGPAGSSLSAVGGQDLRDEIYSWPTTNPCRVDQETVAGGYTAPDFFEVSLVNAYGLDALETLLFSGPGNACPNQVDINSSGSWAALGDAGVATARAAYAAALVDGVADTAAQLAGAWDPDGGDFAGKLAMVNVETPYASEQEALNAVFNGLFYLETATKDRKLAVPIGLRDCAAATCPDDVELWASGTSLAAIEGNLIGFQALFTGAEGGGFEERLEAAGHADLAVEINDKTDAALARVRSMDGSLVEILASSPAEAEALHADVKAVADLLKGDLATVMMLEIPSEAAGDND
ncbi:MAG: imelysin family protein [Myxococcota bacterium]|nr:imelysin family protein [Myxococcota bacterium]